MYIFTFVYDTFTGIMYPFILQKIIYLFQKTKPKKEERETEVDLSVYYF